MHGTSAVGITSNVISGILKLLLCTV